MLFDSSFRKELSRSFGGTAVVLITIVVTMMLIRTLGLAANGRVAPSDVVLMLGYTMIGYLPTVLSLALFISVVSTLTRMHRDSEMAVWFASGQSLSQFLRPILRFAAPVVALIAAVMLLVRPWAAENAAALRERYEQRSDLARVSPGQFQTSRSGDKVFFIDKAAPDDATGRNVFILEQKPDRESVTTAQAGRIEPLPDGGRQLVLRHGARTDLELDGGTRTISRFDEYLVRIAEPRVSVDDSQSARVQSTLALLEQRNAERDGELAYRLGTIVASANLLLIGLGLAAGGARRMSNWTLVNALLAFVIYFNLLNLVQASVANGRLQLWPAILAVHGGVCLLGLALLWWRSEGSARWGSRRAARAVTP